MATATSRTITLQGRSGATYQFLVHPWGTDFKPLGGVYTLLQQPAAGVIYIGQTGNLAERFNDHHKADCCERHGAAWIGVHAEGSEQRRLAIESDLVANYNPPCNG